jgi:hypothetical protein
MDSPEPVRVFMPALPKDTSGLQKHRHDDQSQYDLYEKEFGQDWNTLIVPCKPGFSWSISGTVPADTRAAFVTDLTVRPSIDASASGHWHGFITNGEIT